MRKGNQNSTEQIDNYVIHITDTYDLVETIGGGTCGDVIKGRNRKTGEIVAMKKIKYLQPELGFPVNVMHEINFLRLIDNNENIIKLISVDVSPNRFVYLIFDYCDYDLQGILNKIKLSYAQVKCYMRQFLIALDICCQNKLIHRDLKPANILLTPDNVVKLCDFGLAKKIEDVPKKKPTNKVITIWYRPPELLLGTDHYGTEIDIWSSGCILYEMITGEVLFRSNYDNEIDEINAIFRVHGTPTEEEWPGWTKLPNSNLVTNSINSYSRPNFQEYLNNSIPKEFNDAIDLILKMLEYDPTKRISVQDALKHPFIDNDFESYLHSKLPTIELSPCHQNQINSRTTSKSKHRNCSNYHSKAFPDEIPDN